SAASPKTGYNCIISQPRQMAREKEEGRREGCVRGFWWSVESVLPVGSPGIAVEGAAQGRHAVGPPYPPTRPRLLHPPPDPLLAGPLHQSAADRLALRQPLGITQLTRTVREVTRQFRQRSPLGC